MIIEFLRNLFKARVRAVTTVNATIYSVKAITTEMVMEAIAVKPAAIAVSTLTAKAFILELLWHHFLEHRVD